jgi:hypothetical protein
MSMITIIACTVPFPFFSVVYPNPFYELALRLWRLGLVPYNIGRSIGIPGLVSALPYLIVASFYCAFAVKACFEGLAAPCRRALFLAAISVSCVSLALYSLAWRDENLEGKTNDLFGIVFNYEPPPYGCGGPPASVCAAIYGRTADALERYRSGTNGPEPGIGVR